MRRIDADALMQSLGITDMDCDKCAWCDKEWNCCKRGGDFEDACCAIENAPTIEPERKKGKWIRIIPTTEDSLKGIAVSYECSVCSQHQYRYSHFCPNCGADMRGDSNE